LQDLLFFANVERAKATRNHETPRAAGPMPVACAVHNEMKNTPEQMFQILVACQEPKFPSQVDSTWPD